MTVLLFVILPHIEPGTFFLPAPHQHIANPHPVSSQSKAMSKNVLQGSIIDFQLILEGILDRILMHISEKP